MQLVRINRLGLSDRRTLYDPAALAYADSVTANGGTFSAARLGIVSDFILAERAAGIWELTDDYWGFWAENPAQALTSLKQRRLATAVNSPVFTADRQYAFDGATSYINTGFIPSAHSASFSGTNQRIDVYERTNVSAGRLGAGTRNNNASSITINPRNGGTMNGNVNNSSSVITFALPTADSRGLKAISRAGGGTTALGYDRGARLTDATGLTVGSGVSTVPLFVGCFNDNGTPAQFRAAAIGFCSIGGPLSDGQELARYNNVQAWATSVGAQV